MFKSIFENTLGDKLNSFNNSGKSAIEWMDKFRQTLDITEKIQQQFNGADRSNISNYFTGTSSANSNNDIVNNANSNSNISGKAPSTNSANVPNNNINNETMHSVNNSNEKASSNLSNKQNKKLKNLNKEDSFDNIDNYVKTTNNVSSVQTNQEPSVQMQNSEPLETPVNGKKSAKGNVKNKLTRRLSITTNGNGSSNYMNETNDAEAISPSTSTQKMADSSLNSQAKSLNVESEPVQPELPSYSALVQTLPPTRNSKQLVRQSSEILTQVPFKPFQKINSETVEIPGLNVKVVRYRVEHDLGTIDPHLYKNYSSKGADSSSVVSKGKLFFSLHYNEDIQSLSVTVSKAELTNTSQSTPSTPMNKRHSISTPNSPNLSKPDTYVKVLLLPDKKKKFQTKVQRKTSTPMYEETFYFQVPFNELQTKTLFLSLLEFVRFSKHDLIGSIRLGDLNTIKDLSTSDVEFSKNLVPILEDDMELGELTVTLCYLPAAGRLTVTIVKAINLKAMDITGKSDPYVKVAVISKGKRIKKKKTSVMKNTLHPVFNESMLFDIPQDQIEQYDMIIKVIDYDRVGANELIGCIGIGPSFSGTGRDHWYRMLENPRKPMTQAYFLRDGSFLREGLPAKIERALSSFRQESIDSRNSDL